MAPARSVTGGYYDSGSETEDDENRYVLQPRDNGDEGRAVNKRRRLEDVVAEGPRAPPSPTASASSEGTISDGGATAVVEPMVFRCPFCRKEFYSRQAVRGHMRVHRARERQEQGKAPPVSSALIAKRDDGNGSSGLTAAAVPKNEDDNSRAIVVSEPGLPVAQQQAIAVPRTNLSNNQGSNSPQTVSDAGSAADPANQAVAHRPAAAAPYVAAHHHAPPQPAAALLQLLPLPRGQAGGGPPYRCKVEGCNKEYNTHQGLGGHVAGHINKEKQAAALAVQGGNGGDGASVPGGAKPERMHRCKVKDCGREFLTGVALGGHMRKHFNQKKEQQQQQQEEEEEEEEPEEEEDHDLSLELTLAPPSVRVPPPALAPAIVEAASAPSAPFDATRVVRIFGVNIPKPVPAEEDAEPSGEQ